MNKNTTLLAICALHLLDLVLTAQFSPAREANLWAAWIWTHLGFWVLGVLKGSHVLLLVAIRRFVAPSIPKQATDLLFAYTICLLAGVCVWNAWVLVF